MLEILALLWLTGHIGSILEPKNQPRGRYKALAVLLWLIGQFVGMVIGVMLTGDAGFGTYLLALIGALAGAATAIAIANNLPARAPADAPNHSGK